jgi:hypothetical protein
MNGNPHFPPWQLTEVSDRPVTSGTEPEWPTAFTTFTLSTLPFYLPELHVRVNLIDGRAPRLFGQAVADPFKLASATAGQGWQSATLPLLPSGHVELDVCREAWGDPPPGVYPDLEWAKVGPPQGRYRNANVTSSELAERYDWEECLRALYLSQMAYQAKELWASPAPVGDTLDAARFSRPFRFLLPHDLWPQPPPAPGGPPPFTRPLLTQLRMRLLGREFDLHWDLRDSFPLCRRGCRKGGRARYSPKGRSQLTAGCLHAAATGTEGLFTVDDASGTVYIAFRGTQQMQDAFTDARLVSLPCGWMDERNQGPVGGAMPWIGLWSLRTP